MQLVECGLQKRLELTDGRKGLLFAGDEIIVCYGNRYAPDQYEAVIGNDLSSCDLIAAGGVAAQELSRNLRMLEPTPRDVYTCVQGLRLPLASTALSVRTLREHPGHSTDPGA